MVIKYKNNISIVDGTNGAISLSDFVEIYIVTGSPTLTGAWSIIASGSPSEGMTCFFFWKGRPDFNGQTVKILGETIPSSVSGVEFICMAVYEGSSWSLAVMADLLQSTGTGIQYSDITLTGEIINADINASAAIAYSKLSLTAAILNADINASAAIAYTKLSLTGAVVNADINASAAIAYTKLSLTNSIINADIGAAAAIVYSKLSLTDSIVNADINSSAAILHNKLAALTPSMALVTDLTGFITESTASAAEIAHLVGTTSPIQTQIAALTPKALVQGSINIGSVADTATSVSIKTNAQILIGNGTTAASQPITNDIAITSAGVATIQPNAVVPSKLSSNARKELVAINASFETGYLGSKKIRVPFNSNLIYIYVSVDKAIEASDIAVINLKDHLGTNIGGGSLVVGDLTIAAGSAMGTTVNSLIDTNNNFAAGESLIIETRKTTSANGGTVWVSFEFEKID